MKLEDIENAINQNQFWDMWNNFNTKQLILPIQNYDISRAHFENLYKDIPINQINSDQRIIIQEKFHTLEETIKDNQNLLVFPLLGKNWPHRQNLSSRGKLVVQTALKMKCSNAAAQRCRVQREVIQYCTTVRMFSWHLGQSAWTADADVFVTFYHVKLKK